MPPVGTSGGSGQDPRDTVPPIPRLLLEYLERTYPDRMPDERMTLDEIRVRTGQVTVVRHLRKQYERQQENVLTPTAMK